MGYTIHPARKRDIKRLLEESYEVISASEFKTTAAELKKYPKMYLRKFQRGSNADKQRYIMTERPYKMMNFASWERARSCLDQSIKDSVGLAIAYKSLSDKALLTTEKNIIKHFNLDYVSSFLLGSLYFSHLHAVLSGLHLGGIIVVNDKFLVRNYNHRPKWIEKYGKWESKGKYVGQQNILREYDALQRHHAQWLPVRDEPLKNLKGRREKVTYYMEELGGYGIRDSLTQFSEVFKFHLSFQKSLLSPLKELISDIPDNRTYKPNIRIARLIQRFDEYEQLCDRLALV
jgi:hypothetical protein